MSSPIVILAKQGSRFGPALAEAIASRGMRCDVRSIDAALDGAPVTIDDDGVRWEGIDLARARAVFLEAPLYCWPQPSTTVGLSPDPSIRAAQVRRQREASALAISAVRIVATRTRVINRPEAGALAASRPVALAHLEAAGIPVHPWKLIAAPGAGASGTFVLDVIGAERWHSPAPPAPGEPCLSLEDLSGEVHGVLVIGGKVAGATRYPSPEAWAVRQAGEFAGPGMVPSVAAEPALAAAAGLDLEVAEVWLGGDTGVRPAVLTIEAGPVLEAWDQPLRGRVAAQLAAHLIDVAASSEGGGS